MKDQELIDLIDHDLSGTLSAHNEQIEIVSEWIKNYNGEPLGNEDDTRSTIVWKLIKKQGEALISNLSKPFIGSHEIVDLSPLTDKDAIKSKIYSKVCNHMWSKEFNNNKFVKSISRLSVKEGTVFVRVGWNKKSKIKKVKIEDGTPDNVIQRLADKGASITRDKNNVMWATTETITTNRPTAKPLRLEDCYVDPTADTFEESEFFAFDYVTSISELKSQPDLYSEDSVRKLERILDTLDDTQENSYEVTHRYNKYAFEFSDNARKKVRVTEYWGNYDLNGDGSTVPIMAVTAKYGGERVILRMEENKLPFKKMPFVCIPLIEKEFSIYGDSLASMITDEQNFSTSIVRGIIDNMSMSNNGTKFVRKNTLDPVNQQRLLDGDRVVEVNTNESINNVIQDGVFNQLPSDVYNTLSMIETQAESITGISRMMQGIPGSEMKASSANFSATMSQSQIRLLDMTTSITNGLRSIFYMWISMSMEYLSDEEIMKITGYYIPELKARETQKISEEMGIQELPPETQQKAMLLVMEEVNDMFNMKDLKYDIKMKVGTDGLKEIKINQINMLMQQVTGLVQAGVAPAKMLRGLLADMMENMDRPDLAKELEEYNPQPDPMQVENAKAELDIKKAEAMKSQALARNADARTSGIAGKLKSDAMKMPLDLDAKAIDNMSKAKEIETIGADNGQQ